MDLQPTWSPDGGSLAFISDRAGQHHVWVVPVESGRPAGPARQLTAQEATDMFPAWSPDGASIAYRRGTGNDMDIWIVPSDGEGAPRQLTHGAEARQVRWEPDGTFLLVAGTWGDRTVEIRRISLVAGDTAPLAPEVVMGDAAALGLFDVSADGSLLAFVREATAGDIWILEATRHRF